MRILVDTGVLLRAFDRANPASQRTVFRALRKLWSNNDDLTTTAQNIAEFWNVATRPTTARGGYGLSVTIVEQRVLMIEKLGAVLPFSMRAYQEWRRLLVAHSIVGVAVHDARLVATMREAGIDHILTLNATDFQRYPGLTVLTPSLVVSP